MSGSTVWMPTLSKATSQSYEWRIENFSKQQLRQLRVENGISSSEFKLSIVTCDKITEHNLRLRLTCDSSKIKRQLRWSQWLQLSLFSNTRIDRESCSKNICTAWIFGKRKERMCMLRKSTGLSGFSFTNPEFVLYDDLFDKDRGLHARR